VPSVFRALAPLAAAALATATLTLPAGTASAASWPVPVALSGVPGNAEGTHVAIAPDGTATAALVAYDEPSDSFRVLASSRPPRGTWSTPVPLSAPSVVSTEPAIAIGPDGTTTIAWRLAPSEDDFVVQAATRSPGGGWSPAQSLSQLSTDEYTSGGTNPQVRLAAASDGTVTAVWPQWITDPVENHFDLQAATRAASGTWSAPETFDDTLDGLEWEYRTPEVAAGPTGQVAVVWGVAGGTGAGAYVRTRQGAGPWSPGQRLGNGYWGGRPDLAYAPDGTLGVVWTGGFNTPTVTTLTPGGQWATPRVLSQTTVRYAELDLAAGPGSGFVATWTSDETADQDRVYVATGGPTGPWATQALAPAASGTPVVAVKTDGTAVVMWLWNPPAVNDYAIQASVRPPGGAWEAPSTVRDLPADYYSSENVALTSGPGGSLAAMWAEYDTADIGTAYAVSQDPAVPDTGRITGPKRIKPGKKGSFAFTGPAGAAYECRVDKTRKQQHGKTDAARKRPVPWKACTSPHKVKTRKLKPGKHTLYVRAVQFGLTDPTPSARKFKVK